MTLLTTIAIHSVCTGVENESCDGYSDILNPIPCEEIGLLELFASMIIRETEPMPEEVS